MLLSVLISALICASFAFPENIDVELLTVNETDIEHKSFKHDIKRMPESITFRVRSDSGRNAILRLVKIPPLPTYAIIKNHLSAVKNERQDLAAYKDDSCKAVILVTRHPQSLHYTLEGHLQIGLKLIHIKPTEDGSGHIVVKQETLLHYTPEQHHRSKRSLKVYTVEVGFVADYENFFSFFGRNNNNLQLAEAEMRNYYAFIAEKMKVRYHHINEVDGTIAFDVVTSGLVIIEDRVDSWFTENIKTGRVVEAEEALNATRYWYASLPAGIILPDSDHYMFFTGYDLAHAESLANAGRAYTGVMCREYNGGVSKSHSIVEDHRDGETGTTASHELGHALNANHDSDVGCSDVNRYIMAASSNPIFDAALAQRPWQFSTCSVRDMKTYVERSDVNCLDDNRYGTGVVSSTELAGQYFSRDEQCAMKLGTNATFCAFPYQTDKDKLCYLGWCAYPNQPFNCTSSKYMEYTTCDTGRWCHRGLCIKANNTAPVFVNIPTGSVDIGENAQGVVYTVQTYDPDVGDVMNFDLTWDPVSAAGFFIFNQISQQVSIKPGLHLKTDGFTLTNFSLILSVDDGLLRSLPANIDFKIIADVNHPPVFTNPTYSVQINEGKAGDVVIPSLLSSVSDRDNSVITFSLLPTTSSSYFTINPSTGRIQYAKDYDTDPTGLSSSVTLTVKATDQTSLSAIANFNLTIRNVNQAPRFLNLPGVINIAEALPSGASLYTIRATDPDSTDTLTYNFINPSSFVNTYLNLNSRSGLLTFTRTQELDYETQDPKSMIVSISVSNNFHSINDVLTVNVVNSNEPPYFSRSRYNVTTTTGPAERIIVNRLVNLVQDPDLTDTTFTYSIQNELYSNYFKIDQSSGEISFAVEYGTDRTTFPSVVALIVIATDSGGLKGTATYVITINLAELPPVITNLPSSVSVDENTATGRTLFIVTSEDINPGDTITYMIETVNFITQLFTINNNGVVSVSDGSILDYESLPSVISVRITAFDGALFSTPAILTVNLLNVNEAPVFTQTQYNFNVYGSKAGQVVISSLTQFATDPDQNDVLTFLIVPSNPNFYINPSTGAISFTSDYPSTSAKQITLPVVVRDLRNMNGLTNVTVTVIEVNQPPVLTNLPQMIQVLENTPPGTTVFTVSSQDADGGDTITYTMQTDNTATQLFSINSAGVISVKSGIILDFESLPSVFYLTIRVFDGQLYSTPANLTIQLLNVNEAPRFNQSQYSFTVNEGKAGQVVISSLTQFATDPDQNDVLTFLIVPSNPNFYINPSTGAISFTSDYPSTSAKQITLPVVVRDLRNMNGLTNVTVTVIEVNQPPVLTNLPQMIQVLENTPPGTTVFTVSSQDADGGDTITYTMQTDNTATQLFSINSAGVISVKSGIILDFESLPLVFYLTIRVFDGQLYSTPANLTIQLLNVNEAPRFNQSQYSFTVNEGKAGQVVINSLTQFATDPDQNDVLTFLIVPSNPNFYINPSTGAISFTSDYPSTSAKQITLPLVVRDLRNMNGLTNVTVTVIEVNQPPVLTNLPQMIQVLENTPPGTTVFTVSSQDADAGDTITYTMQTDNTATQLFSINSAGVISVKSGIILDFESLPSVFYLTIRAFDGQLYSTPANLTIQLQNVNEAPRFNQSQYSFTVNEGKAGQILVPSLLTYIIDEDANEQFRFSLVAGTSSNRFSIDQSTGAVRFSADYDTDPNRAPSQVMLDVMVRDTGLSFSTGKIILNINNVNQAPVFTNLPSEVQISSDTSADTVVFTVSFSDPDSLDTLTLNGVFTNSISGNSFSFNQINGELKYLGVVSIPRHVLQCTLSDGKITTTAQLNILVYQDPQVTTTLVPTTTTAPRDLVITNLPQTITVAENVNSGTIVFNVTTSDAVTNSLSFQLQHLNTGDLFAINNDGVIYVTNGDVLDYESLPSLIYVTITANNGIVSSNSVNLTIRLTNVNEPPKFNQTLYSFIIGDPKLGEDLTQTLIPYINDPTSKLFSLASTTNSQYFTINPITGAIRLANNPPVLPKKVNLTVVVQDSSLGGQTATAVISLFMNLPPRFTNLPSTVTIPSDTRPGGAIFTLQTTDPNPGDILTVRFITSQSKFGLGSITNAVFVQSGSSFPTNESYAMEFSVSDGQKLVSSVLTVHVYIPAKTVTEIPTSQTTKPTVVDPKTTTSNPAADSDDNLPLLERPWAITAIIITAVLVPTLIILVAVVICRRRHGYDDRSSSNEKIYDHRSNRSLPLSFYPSYNRGKSVYQTQTYPHNFN